MLIPDLRSETDDHTLYDALVAKDQRYDGLAFVCVRTTGIFCRLVCPARNPKRENCTFEPTIAACVLAGYRPCKRCHPMGTTDPAVTALLAALETDPLKQWTEKDVIALGIDPSTARRAFRRWFGVTFIELARQRRLGSGVAALADGQRVIDAQHEAGWDSPAAFRTAFAKIMDRPPGSFAVKPLLMADWINTPLGPMIAVADRHALKLLEFVERKALRRELAALNHAAQGSLGFGRPDPVARTADELAAFFRGDLPSFTIPLAPLGAPFAQSVWKALQQIPAGDVTTYGALARKLNRPNGARAVARANGANPIAIVIPCHRVLGAVGSLTGYGGGLWRKRQLIDTEIRYRGTDI